MKKYWIIIITTCFITACSFGVQAGIKGSIINGVAGDSIALHDPFARQAPPLEKVALSKKGTFEFSYTPSDIGFFYIMLSTGKTVLTVLKPGNNGQVEIDASTGQLTKVIDSEENTLLKSFQEMVAEFDRKQKTIDETANKTAEQKQKEKQGREQEKTQAIQNILLKNPGNYAAAALIEYLPADNFVTVYDSILSTLVKKYPANTIVQAKYQEVASMKKLAVGYPAPEITMEDTTGRLFSLSSMKGKLVLVDFWASWCRPCRMESPNIVRLYNKYKQYGFDILSISLDNNKENWLRAIQADGLRWNHISDLKGWSSAAGAAYGVRAIPFTVLVDQNGNIVAKGLRGESLEEKVKEILLQQ